MISGRNPWRVATTVDDTFKAYLRDPNFLRKMLPISEGANLILRNIFTRKEKNRASLEYIRHLVVHLDTFFMSPDEIVRAGPYVQRIAEYYFRKSQRQIVYHETNTSYGAEMGALDEQRAFSPPRKSDDVGQLSDVALDSPRPPQEPDIQQINRSEPTNPSSIRSLGVSGIDIPTPDLPALPPKVYAPPRHPKGSLRSPPAVADATDHVAARSLGDIRRRVERIVV